MDECLPATLLRPSKQEVNFPAVFQLVKAIVRANSIADDTRTTLKGWLKSNDPVLILMSLTVRSDAAAIRYERQLHHIGRTDPWSSMPWPHLYLHLHGCMGRQQQQWEASSLRG
jgi:hypothetical protein